MSDYKPANHRIITIRQKNRILHIEDALDIDRIRLELWDYERGNGARAQAEAYLDRHQARAIAAELATGRLTAFHDHQVSGGGHAKGQLIARLFRIENADTKNPIRITITNGEGIKQPDGLISLKKDANHHRLQILISRPDAKTIGFAILHHIQAWEIITFKQRTADTWKPGPQPPEIHTCPDCHTRPCICDTLNPSEESQAPDDSLLRYANGDPVDEDDPREIQALQIYAQAKHALPQSKAALVQWVNNTTQPRQA